VYITSIDSVTSRHPMYNEQKSQRDKVC